MHSIYSRKLGKAIVVIKPGDYFATRDGEVLYTVLGSCIATCMYDKMRQVGGMNHFLLPGMVHPDEILSSEVGRFGMFAMELLIGELIKLGAQRGDLEAKVFGGGSVLQFRKRDGDVTGCNIQFARKFLELEGIPIIKEDLGGTIGRKIFFFSDSARVLLKRFDVLADKRLLNDETSYRSNVFRKVGEPAPAIFFEPP